MMYCANIFCQCCCIFYRLDTFQRLLGAIEDRAAALEMFVNEVQAMPPCWKYTFGEKNMWTSENCYASVIRDPHVSTGV